MRLIRTRHGYGAQKLLILLGVVLLAFAGGYLVRSCARSPQSTPAQGPAGEASKELWTCSMHPQVKLPKPGKCPICGMDLILAGSSKGGDGVRVLAMSESAKALAEIQTSLVERKFVETEIRMVGKIDYDETRLSYISAWVEGRLDRLYVDYTGISVNKGDHMVYMYSPDILTAQQELVQAVKAVKELAGSKVASARETAEDIAEAAREKLRLWGLEQEQIDEIESLGKASEHIEIRSPASGVVISKNAMEGMFVKTGTRIYTIADLSRVWVKLDAYESDIQWLRYGQKIEFESEAYPGQQFKGMISFIDPVLNERTRTVKVRVIAENAEGKLKPGMFVKAVVRPEVAAGGKVMDPSLAGKWVSPMHPEVIKDQTGKCDVCGMPLVQAEELGYTSADKGNAPLVIPVSAPLITGERAVVYVRHPSNDGPEFEGREIVLGPRVGDFYIVGSGLEEGDEVVTKGAFKIDSALQIEAKPSMMNSPSVKKAPQTLCPIMGGAINKDEFVDYNGKRIYFCCPGCEPEFSKDPEKYIKTMEDAGIELEKVPE